jgi:hypothetical protein
MRQQRKYPERERRRMDGMFKERVRIVAKKKAGMRRLFDSGARWTRSARALT